MLMAALYVAVGYQYRNAQAGRDLLEQNLLARAVLTRMGNEIKSSLVVPAQPSTTAAAPSTASTASATTASTSTAAPASGSTPGAATGTAVVYNRGLQGDGNRLVIFVSRAPTELYPSPANGATEQPLTGISDLRQISYWLSQGGNGGGLARRETKAVTSDAATTAWSGADDDPAAIIADEVRSLQFRYFDGGAWHDDWDASSVGSDGKTPRGPPAAVEIILGVKIVAEANADGSLEGKLKYFTHRVAIPASYGRAPQTTANASP